MFGTSHIKTQIPRKNGTVLRLQTGLPAVIFRDAKFIQRKIKHDFAVRYGSAAAEFGEHSFLIFGKLGHIFKFVFKARLICLYPVHGFL